MTQKKKENDATYWHPAFFAGIQIELAEDADNLVFENEHQLGTKPMEIDVLIIKKETDRPVKKNIGRIFKSIISSNTKVRMILSVWMIFTKSMDIRAFTKQMPGM